MFCWPLIGRGFVEHIVRYSAGRHRCFTSGILWNRSRPWNCARFTWDDGKPMLKPTKSISFAERARWRRIGVSCLGLARLHKLAFLGLFVLNQALPCQFWALDGTYIWVRNEFDMGIWVIFGLRKGMLAGEWASYSSDSEPLSAVAGRADPELDYCCRLQQSVNQWSRARMHSGIYYTLRK